MLSKYLTLANNNAIKQNKIRVNLHEILSDQREIQRFLYTI
jgi:hypothetical protein